MEGNIEFYASQNGVFRIPSNFNWSTPTIGYQLAATPIFYKKKGVLYALLGLDRTVEVSFIQGTVEESDLRVIHAARRQLRTNTLGIIDFTPEEFQMHTKYVVERQNEPAGMFFFLLLEEKQVSCLLTSLQQRSRDTFPEDHSFVNLFSVPVSLILSTLHTRCLNVPQIFSSPWKTPDYYIWNWIAEWWKDPGFLANIKKGMLKSNQY